MADCSPDETVIDDSAEGAKGHKRTTAVYADLPLGNCCKLKGRAEHHGKTVGENVEYRDNEQVEKEWA